MPGWPGSRLTRVALPQSQLTRAVIVTNTVAPTLAMTIERGRFARLLPAPAKAAVEAEVVNASRESLTNIQLGGRDRADKKVRMADW